MAKNLNVCTVFISICFHSEIHINRRPLLVCIRENVKNTVYHLNDEFHIQS